MSAQSVASAGDGPTVVSTFAGCGGSSLGYKLAGFRELLAVEWDDNAVATFRLNFPEVPVYHGDIAKLSGAECLRLAGIAPGELDVLDGSPPCQGFSTAGKRKWNDPRNSLFREYARLLRELQPRCFVMENVTGMVKGCMKQAYLTIVATLRACGYRVKGEVLNAMYFNVPQSRQRVIIIGVRNDLGIEPSHPKPQTKPRSVGGCFVGDGRLIPTPSVNRIKASGRHRTIVKSRPSPTLQKRDAGLQNDGLYWSTSDGGLRELSPLERQRVASFPDYYQFAGNAQDVAARIGNSVPPNLMRTIAEHLRREILHK
jgi:DNA (cytosine-5)-methyltransferase 1